MTTQVLKKCSLFEGIEENQFSPLLQCLGAVKRRYKKDEYIFRAGDKAKSVGIVLSGEVLLIQEDYWGNRSIVSDVLEAGLFCEFACDDNQILPLSAVAFENSDILIIDYKKIVTMCSSACVYHSRLITNMIKVLAEKNINLTQKIDFLSKRTIRQKLLSYLSSIAAKNGSSFVTIPYNRQQLAEFLCVERSALSREISKMQKEKLIKCRGDTFYLLDNTNN